MKVKEQQFVIGQDGNIVTIYDDDLYQQFSDGADIKIARASHVEPHYVANLLGGKVEGVEGGSLFGSGWTADLSPVGGPKLGLFQTRTEALQAEFDWLEQNMPDIPFPATEEKND